MPVSVTLHVTPRRSRYSKSSVEWLPSVSVISVIIIRSSSTTEVSLQRSNLQYLRQHELTSLNVIDVSSQGKSEPSISPSAMNDESRHETIARQQRALYGNGSDAPAFYDGNSFNDDQTPRPANANVAPSGGRGPSPMAYNSFGIQDHSQPAQAEDGTKGTSPNATGTRSRAGSNSSPSSNNQNFSLFDSSTAAQQSSRTSTSSPGGSPRASKPSAAPAPIGTRPAQAAIPAVNKRSTPPASSPLSFGFAPNENLQGERASSAASNPQGSGKESMNGSMNWGNSSGVWGKSNLGNVQASVWG